MGKAEIVDDSEAEDEKYILQLQNGSYVLLETSGDKTEAFIISEPTYDSDIVCKIGGFEFSLIEEPNGYDFVGLYKVTNMFLEGCDGKYLRQGIGTAIVELQEKMYGPVVFGEDTGTSNDDGSHLTGSGKPFADAMSSRKR